MEGEKSLERASLAPAVNALSILLAVLCTILCIVLCIGYVLFLRRVAAATRHRLSLTARPDLEISTAQSLDEPGVEMLANPMYQQKQKPVNDEVKDDNSPRLSSLQRMKTAKMEYFRKVSSFP